MLACITKTVTKPLTEAGTHGSVDVSLQHRDAFQLTRIQGHFTTKDKRCYVRRDFTAARCDHRENNCK